MSSGPKRKLQLPFAPRPWQVRLIDDPAPRIVAVVHRRAGKSTALMWRGLKRALTEKKALPRVVHILPFGVMWQRTGLWDALAKAAESIPGAVVRRSDMAVKLPNGGTYQCGGADNPDSWRGGAADEAIVDEADDTPPSLIPLVIEPMLADRMGTLVRSGTPKGRGILQAAYDHARVTQGYSTYLLDYTQTQALTPAAIARLRLEMSAEEFAQEMECSFASPNSGSYYGKLMDEAERSGRITTVPHEPNLLVTTAWDLGVHDSTAIWFAQVTRGGEWRVIDYLEDSGAGLDHYAQLLQQRPYVYAKHLLPHDASIRELGSGKSRVETLARLGVRPTRIVRTHSVADGINAVRMILPRCWFDAARCQRGIHALRHYRREWNEAAQAWRATPVHDHASHGCLTAHALVLTDRGHVFIKDMKAGDRVWTPAGYAEVTWAGAVKRAPELIEITLADGRHLACTPEHKIATKRGFVRADAIRYLDVVVSGTEWQSILIGLCSKLKSTGYRAIITDAITGAKRDRQTFIARSGSTMTGLFQKVASFTTEMAIRLTTPWAISNASTSPSISECTLWNGVRLGYSKTLRTFVACELPNGTQAQRGLSGTGIMGEPSRQAENGMQSVVSSVVRFLLHLIPSGQSGVTSIARWKTCGSAEESSWVYDLTVKNHACYQANGFLVSNSDSMRYLALGVREIGATVRGPEIGAPSAAPPRALDALLDGQWDTNSAPAGRRSTNWMSV